MRNKVNIVLILLFSAFGSSAQKSGNIWYFGENAGLDFNSGAPVAIPNGAIVTQEGCATISDANGNVLFYSNGEFVYNRNHQIMPNGSGLLGGESTTQSCLIVPQPGSSTLYYIFTIPEIADPVGLCYSKVDMTLDGGDGDVINKNTPVLADSLTEKLAAVYHSNGSDVWIAVHKNNSDAYYAYHLSASGLSAPVITNIGTLHQEWTGYMKFSPDGTRLAAALFQSAQMDILDFNVSTGVFSNPITFSAPIPVYSSYGLEFSPSGSVLYLVNLDGGAGEFYQFDMNAGSGAAILASATVVHNFNSGFTGAMCLGPDGKIYYNMYQTGFLGVINDPEILGTGCNPIDSAVPLSPGLSRIGLPNFISGLYGTAIMHENHCLGDSTLFSLLNISGVAGVQWNFGDTASGSGNISFLTNTGHVFTSAGSFQVQALKFLLNGDIDTLIETVTIYDYPQVNLGPDSVLCTGDTLILNAGGGFSQYTWQDLSQDSIIAASQSGIYYVAVSNNGCMGTDTVQLQFSPCAAAQANFYSSDTLFCEKKCIDFFDLSTNSPTSWQWFFPGADSTTSNVQNPAGICYNSYGSFDVTLIACNGSGCDTLVMTGFINELQPPPIPVITSNFDTLFSTPAFAYQWFSSSGAIPGANGAYYIYPQPGTYSVIVMDSNGCATSSAIIGTGINEGEMPFIHIFPNPSYGLIEVVLTAPAINFEGFTVYDQTGRLIRPHITRVKEMEFLIDLTDEPSGIYNLHFITGGKTYVKKIVIFRQ